MCCSLHVPFTSRGPHHNLASTEDLAILRRAWPAITCLCHPFPCGPEPAFFQNYDPPSPWRSNPSRPRTTSNCPRCGSTVTRFLFKRCSVRCRTSSPSAKSREGVPIWHPDLLEHSRTSRCTYTYTRAWLPEVKVERQPYVSTAAVPPNQPCSGIQSNGKPEAPGLVGASPLTVNFTCSSPLRYPILRPRLPRENHACGLSDWAASRTDNLVMCLSGPWRLGRHEAASG